MTDLLFLSLSFLSGLLLRPWVERQWGKVKAWLRAKVSGTEGGAK